MRSMCVVIASVMIISAMSGCITIKTEDERIPGTLKAMGNIVNAVNRQAKFIEALDSRVKSLEVKALADSQKIEMPVSLPDSTSAPKTGK